MCCSSDLLTNSGDELHSIRPQHFGADEIGMLDLGALLAHALPM